MRFAKKHNKKGLKKMQANNTKAMSVHAEAVKALVKPKEVKPKMPKGASHKLTRLALPCLPNPSTGSVLMPTWPGSIGSAGQRPKPKPRPRLQLQLQLQLPPPKVPRPPRVPRPLQKLHNKNLCECENRRTGVTPEPLSMGTGVFLCCLYK
ncbi:60S ribosomal protein L29 [Sciurus carolinensis]|uniref:60S ribosomal protein L29 n=1 Tax=Sciurus carolinensis TaxID=30640 RepID=A0AA41MH45_SCICA|nr:60S ribosomal protein L29 [Sciurus carolinensis]